MAVPITVTVNDPHGLAVPGATVQVLERGSARVLATATTDETGSTLIDSPFPSIVRVRADGFEEAVRPLLEAPGGPIAFRLIPAVVQTSIEVVVSEPAAFEAAAVSTAREIDRGVARTVFDAVDQLLPSVYVTRRGVMGYGIATNGTGGVTIRGIGGSPNTGVLIVIDGRPDMQGLMGHPLPDFYSLSNAENIRVIEGPASVLYGSNAMGGAIEIIPARPQSGFHTRLASSLGSFYTGQHRLAHGAQFEKFFYTLHAGLDHTSGDRPSSRYRSKDLSLGAGYQLADAWRASLQGRYGHFHVEDPGPITAPLANSYARVGRGGFSLNLDNAYSRTWGYARLFSSHGRHIITDGFRSVDSDTGLRIMQSVTPAPRIVLDLGADAATYGGRARNVKTALDYGEHHVTTAAGFSRLQYVASPRLRLNAGLRIENNSVFGAIFVPEFGATLRLAKGYTLGSMVGKGFRNPTIRELYLFPAPNPLLKPETMWNYQVSFRAEPSRAFQSSVTAYYADLSNMIVTLGRYPNLALRNAGRALNRGVELEARWKPVSRFQWVNSYAYLRSTNLAPFVPAHKWNTALNIDAGKAFLHLGATTVGERWANTAKTAKLDGYSNVTMKCTVPAGSGRSLFFMVDNLLDRSYQVVSGYPMPGINAAGGFTLEF